MSDLRELHACWSRLAAAPAWKQSGDQQTSLRYVRAANGDPAASPRARNWVTMLDAVTQFREREGRAPAAHADDPIERRLARWLQYQRQNRSELCSYQTARLHTAGVELSAREDAWWEAAIAFDTWARSHGAVPRVRSADADERKLGRWAARQRRRRDCLQVEQRDFLNRAVITAG